MRNPYTAFCLLAVFDTLPIVSGIHTNDFLELIGFSGTASAASAGMTALALNAGSKKAAEWFYLSDATRSDAAKAIKEFEVKTRISLSQKKPPFFCSTILYLQGAALAMQTDAQTSMSTTAAMMETGSTSSTVSSLLASYPSAQGYAGYCVQLFPSPSWRQADPPCEGMDAFPEEDVVAGVALYSLKCLAVSDFDWRTISSGYRPGGVSAMTSRYAQVIPLSQAPVCSKKSGADLVVNVIGASTQALFTQCMVGPISAMLTMDVKELCGGGFEPDACLRFENAMDLFFESWNAGKDMASGLQADMTCLLFRGDADPFEEAASSGGGF